MVGVRRASPFVRLCVLLDPLPLPLPSLFSAPTFPLPDPVCFFVHAPHNLGFAKQFEILVLAEKVPVKKICFVSFVIRGRKTIK